MFSKIAVGGAAAVLAASATGVGIAMAADGSSDPQGGAATAAAASPQVFACDGGAQKQVKNRIVNTPFTFTEGATPFVPGAAVSVAGPAVGKDTLVVTFSAETQLQGSTGVQDWIGVEVLLDGVPMQPFTAVGDVMALSGSPTWNMHSATFCGKVGPGPHRVQVRTNLADFDTNDSLTGWLDDYTLSVERSQ